MKNNWLQGTGSNNQISHITGTTQMDVMHFSTSRDPQKFMRIQASVVNAQGN
jgi:hypothetical protein